MALSLHVVFYFSGIGSPSGLGLKEDENLLTGKDGGEWDQSKLSFGNSASDQMDFSVI
jgi:hypothetical protein